MLVLLGVVATAVTIAGLGWAVIRAIFTRPRIVLRPRSEPDALWVDFYNEPIFGWRRHLLLRRQSMTVEWVRFHLRWLDTNIITDLQIFAAIHDFGGRHVERLELPGAFRSASVVIATVQPEAVALAGGIGRVLHPGTYEVLIHLDSDDAPCVSRAIRFVVATSPWQANWIGQPAKVDEVRWLGPLE